MKYTIIPFLLLVALTCATARSIDGSEKEVQEIREETPSSNEDVPFSLSANEDEEARGRLQAFLAKMKEIAAQTLGREESLSANEDEEARGRMQEFIKKLKAYLRKMKEKFSQISGREESFSANEDEEERGRLQAFLAKMKEIAAQTLGREESLSANEDEETRGRLQAFLAKMKEIAAQTLGREESLSAIEDEEARGRLQAFLAKMKEIAAQTLGREESLSANEDEEERLVWLLPLKFLASHLAMEGISKIGSKIGAKLGREELTPGSFYADDDEEERLNLGKMGALLQKLYAKYKAGRNEQTPEISANDDEEERVVWLLPLKFLASHLAMEGLSKIGSKIGAKLGREELTPGSFSVDDDEEERAGLGKIGALIQKVIAKYKAGRNEQTPAILSANGDEEARKIKWFKAMKSIAKFIAKDQLKKHLGEK